MSKLHAPFRFDYVGSFLRPENLLQARTQFEKGEWFAEESVIRITYVTYGTEESTVEE